MKYDWFNHFRTDLFISTIAEDLMNLLISGAAGDMSYELIKQAIAPRAHSAQHSFRIQNKLDMQHSSLSAAIDDITNVATVELAVEGQGNSRIMLV